MKGKYHIVLSDSNLKFDLWLERNITILKGNSGTGKTTLYDMFRLVRLKRFGGVHCNMADKIVVLYDELEDWRSKLLNNHGKIIVADEWFDPITTKEFAEYTNKSDNYFILISRSGRLTYLADFPKACYELVPVKNGELTCIILKLIE